VETPEYKEKLISESQIRQAEKREMKEISQRATAEIKKTAIQKGG
jgi:hypothetical protein